MSDLKRALLIVVGTLCLGLGILGVFLPVLPTTPFLLLAAACFARGSKKFYDRLLSNRYLGEYIRNYRERRGIPLRTKAVGLLFLWAAIGYSSLVAVDILAVRILLLLIAVGVTVHLVSFPTLRR